MILYDANVPGELDRAEAFGNDILRLCVEVGGVLTGEHGVGIEKRDLMPVMFGEENLKQQQRVKCAFDPDLLLNPGKVFPTLHRRAELVLTVRPGTPLADVQALVAGEGQMLAFEPWGGAGSTIGGTVAAGVAGSRRVTAGRLLNRCGHDVIFAPGAG